MKLRPDTPRALAAQATRAHILATARRLFEAHPYADVTMRVIAKAAGCSTGAVFTHWSGKDAVYESAVGHAPVTVGQGRELLALAKAYDPNEARRIMGEPC